MSIFQHGWAFQCFSRFRVSACFHLSLLRALLPWRSGHRRRLSVEDSRAPHRRPSFHGGNAEGRHRAWGQGNTLSLPPRRPRTSFTCGASAATSWTSCGGTPSPPGRSCSRRPNGSWGGRSAASYSTVPRGCQKKKALLQAFLEKIQLPSTSLTVSKPQRNRAPDIS